MVIQGNIAIIYLWHTESDRCEEGMLQMYSHLNVVPLAVLVTIITWLLVWFQLWYCPKSA